MAKAICGDGVNKEMFDNLVELFKNKTMSQYIVPEIIWTCVACVNGSMEQKKVWNQMFAMRWKENKSDLIEQRAIEGKEKLKYKGWAPWDKDDHDREYYWRLHSAEWYKRNPGKASKAEEAQVYQTMGEQRGQKQQKIAGKKRKDR